MRSKEFDEAGFSIRAANNLMEVGIDTPDTLKEMSSAEIEKTLNKISKYGQTQSHVRNQLKEFGFIE